MADINWGMLSDAVAAPEAGTTVLNEASQAAARNQAAKLATQKQAYTEAQDAANKVIYNSAADKFTNGDYRGGTADLIRTGDSGLIGAGNGVQTQDFKQDQDGLQAVGGFAQFLQQHVKDPDARAELIKTNAVHLQAAGAHPQDIAAIAANPSDDNLNAVVAATIPAAKQDELAQGQQNADSTTLNAQTGVTNSQTSRMTEQRMAQTPVGISTEDNVYLPGAGAYAGGTTNPGVGGAPASGASGTDRASRNNNPGNLKDDGKSKWQGMTGVDKDGFVQFDTPANGARALSINIANQARLHGINTIAGLITKYAPAGDGNNTAAYIQKVSQSLGVPANQPLNLQDPNVISKIAPVIMGAEGHGTPAAVQGQQVAQQGASTPGPQQIGNGGPTLISAGVKKASPNDVDPNDPGVAMAARQYAATGEMPPLGSGSGEYRREIIRQAAQIVAANHWTPGQIAANKATVKAAQTALAADNKMYDVIQGSEQTALANGQRYLDLASQMPGNTSFVGYNKLRNALGSEFSDTRVTDARAAYGTFIGEYNRVVNSTPSGAGTLTDASRREAQDTFENSTNQDARVKAFGVMKADMAARKQAQQNIIDRRTGIIANVGQGAAMPQQNTPQRAAPTNGPPGGQYLGTSKKTGRPMYQMPDGSRVLG